MKKIIFKILMGALLIAIIVLVGERKYLSMKKTEYRQQLENTINNKHLEGEDAIGALYFNSSYNDSIEIYKVSSIIDFLRYPLFGLLPGIRSASVWGCISTDYSSNIINVLKSGNYEWYSFKNCITPMNKPFMIIVKKTNRGYDVTGEYIYGIALTYSYPKYLITETSSISKRTMLSNHENYANEDYVTYNYKIKTNMDMIDSYIKNLFKNKYNGITIRNETTRGNERNIKFDMLDGLVRKVACPVNSSLNFRVNKYFELKFDNYFTEMGSYPVVWESGSYGDYTQTIFTSTVTMHYSIQENEGVLEKECRKKTINYLLILEFFYLLLTIIIVRRNRKNIYSQK